jgi:hypothetical protein
MALGLAGVSVISSVRTDRHEYFHALARPNGIGTHLLSTTFAPGFNRSFDFFLRGRASDED